jgi:phytoene dehydrogenase-like protein
VRSAYDVVVVGAGHNGLAAAAYLARAGRSVLVLERRDEVGGATASERPWPGVDARVSRFSYLVSLLPPLVVEELGLDVRLVRRRVSSYTPDPRDGGATGLLVADGLPVPEGWEAFYGRCERVAARVFPTLTEPLPTRDELRRAVDDEAAWSALFERPLGEAVDAAFADDLVRGVVLTDALIGTFAAADEPSLRQNRCFLFHVVGGAWDVPVGGMGAVAGALRDAALRAGAELRTGSEVVAVHREGSHLEVHLAGGGAVAATWVLAGCAPSELDRLRGRRPAEAPEGSQLKVNMLLRRLPRLRDPAVDPRDAFAGTLHVNETASQLARAHAEASAGRIPSLPPCEVYCHSLSDRSILGTDGETLTLFGLHMPARLFDRPGAREEALSATLRSLDSVLAEPIEEVLAMTPAGEPCLEARTPLDLEQELRLPGGHIFHRDLSWPWREDGDGRWGVETDDPRVLICGAGARRGGGVSAIPGRNAAMAVLGR